MKLIDLSLPITSDMPVYSGDPSVKIEQAGVLAADGYEDHYVSFGTHAGTHIDAPAHMIENGKSVDQFPLEKFTGRGVYINVSDGGFMLQALQSANIRKGDIVFFHTGMSDNFYEKEYFEKYPSLPEEIANYLVEKAISIVGVDTCSVDHEEFTAHKVLLQKDILIIENLTNLDKLQDKNFTVYAFPLALQIDGSPVRVVAKIEE
jgi:arylformamidase